MSDIAELLRLLRIDASTHTLERNSDRKSGHVSAEDALNGDGIREQDVFSGVSSFSEAHPTQALKTMRMFQHVYIAHFNKTTHFVQ